MAAKNYKNFTPIFFYFCKILKIDGKNIIKSAKFVVIVLYCTKRKYSKIDPQLKVDIDAP